MPLTWLPRKMRATMATMAMSARISAYSARPWPSSSRATSKRVIRSTITGSLPFGLATLWCRDKLPHGHQVPSPNDGPMAALGQVRGKSRSRAVPSWYQDPGSMSACEPDHEVDRVRQRACENNEDDDGK